MQDTGTSYRPGARFGPAGIRAGSRRLTLYGGYNVPLEVNPFHPARLCSRWSATSAIFLKTGHGLNTTSSARNMVWAMNTRSRHNSS